MSGIHEKEVARPDKDRIRAIADLGIQNSYWNTSAAENELLILPECIIHVKPILSSQINIFPNPVSNGNVVIEYQNYIPKNIQLYNALGQLVMSNVEMGENSTMLNIAHLPDGVYFVKVDEKSYKVLKQ